MNRWGGKVKEWSGKASGSPLLIGSQLLSFHALESVEKNFREMKLAPVSWQLRPPVPSTHFQAQL